MTTVNSSFCFPFVSVLFLIVQTIICDLVRLRVHYYQLQSLAEWLEKLAQFFSNFQDLVDQKWLLLGGTLNELLTLNHIPPPILAKFTRSKFCNQFINKSLLRWVRYGAFHFNIHCILLVYLFVCVLFVFSLFVIWLVVSPPFPQQGQEYAALGALVNDDEPLSSPPGSTEMELKVKQVCPDIVICWELVENTSCDLVRSDTKVLMLSRHNRPSPK